MIFPAISIMQPWPWAILNLGKNCENRSWRLPKHLVGVPVLIHAGKSVDTQAITHLKRERDCCIPPRKRLPTGGIVGAMIFTGCTGSIGPDSEWAEKGLRLQWWIGAAKNMPFYPCRGHLGFFRVDYPYPEGEAFWRDHAYGQAAELVRQHEEKMTELVRQHEEKMLPSTFYTRGKR